ncbi:MAG: hypothetical protein AB7O96_03595 [Pseudobdellovibrionaceae bacterium]
MSKLLSLIFTALLFNGLINGCAHQDNKNSAANDQREPATHLRNGKSSCIVQDGFQKTELEIKGHMVYINGFSFRN